MESNSVQTKACIIYQNIRRHRNSETRYKIGASSFGSIFYMMAKSSIPAITAADHQEETSELPELYTPEDVDTEVDVAVVEDKASVGA